MKLKQITENLMGQQLQNMFNANGAYFSRPNLQTSTTDAETGHDAGSRVAGTTQLPTGVPRKKRHRKFFGMNENEEPEQKRPGVRWGEMNGFIITIHLPGHPSQYYMAKRDKTVYTSRDINYLHRKIANMPAGPRAY